MGNGHHPHKFAYLKSAVKRPVSFFSESTHRGIGRNVASVTGLGVATLVHGNDSRIVSCGDYLSIYIQAKLRAVPHHSLQTGGGGAIAK
jgi:hypothetical protein